MAQFGFGAFGPLAAGTAVLGGALALGRGAAAAPRA
jgi:hypothetical protein